MGKLGNVLIVAGILLIAYTILGAFVGSVYVFSYVRPIKPSTALIFANSLLLLGVISKIAKKA